MQTPSASCPGPELHLRAQPSLRLATVAPSLVVLMGMTALSACSCSRRPKLPPPTCFDVTASSNSEGTRKVFAERHCQGGGVTWSSIIHALIDRRGQSTPVLETSPGWTGEVYLLNRDAHFSIDDSADVARFCSDRARLLASIQRDVQHLNRDAEALRRVMATVSPWALECLAVDGGPPPFPAEWPEELRRQLQERVGIEGAGGQPPSH